MVLINFMAGLCTNRDCPYRHVNVNPKAAICEGFLKGYCADGNEVLTNHVYWSANILDNFNIEFPLCCNLVNHFLCIWMFITLLYLKNGVYFYLMIHCSYRVLWGD